MKELGGKLKTKAEELSDQEFKNLNIEPLYEHSLKIFGDIFESIIGSIFLDCKSISQTEAVLYKLLKPFLKEHTLVESLDDHSRTKLLELWNSKPYSRQFKIRHEV
jgi:dsRNA-specific ribonuclease